MIIDHFNFAVFARAYDSGGAPPNRITGVSRRRLFVGASNTATVSQQMKEIEGYGPD